MTIESIKKIAFEKHGKKLSDEEAAVYAEKYGKLADDELDSVSGGACDNNTNKDINCPLCEAKMKWFRTCRSGTDYICPECKHVMRI